MKNKNLSRTVVIIIIGIAFFIGAIILRQNGYATSKMGSRFGWSENFGNKSWEVTYSSLSGKYMKYIKPESDKVTVEVVTESGELTIELSDKDGNNIFSHKFTDTESMEVSVNGKIKINVTADNHSGGYTVK